MSEVSGQDFQTWNKLHGRDFLKYFLILELLENNSTQLSYIYPPLQDKDKHLINSQIPQFCFPDAETFPRKIEKYGVCLFKKNSYFSLLTFIGMNQSSFLLLKAQLSCKLFLFSLFI